MAFIPEDHIADYLDGTLAGEDLRTFNAALNTDSSLRKAVALQRRIEAELASMAEDEEIAALIKNAETAHPYRPKVRIRRFPPWLAIAALIILAIGTWFILQPKRITPPQLAARYAKLNFPESVVRIRESVLPMNYQLKRDIGDNTNLLQNASSIVDSAQIKLYTRSYPEALAAYRQIPPALLNDSLRFQKSLLLLYIDDPSTALLNLEEISTTFDGGIYWYKALALLYLNDPEAALTQLQLLLEDQNSSYYSEALLLKKEIDSSLTFPFSKRRLSPQSNTGD